MYTPHFGIRTPRYKLIYFYQGLSSWELYDLQTDPQELHNVYANKDNNGVITDLKQRLKKLMVQYKDSEALNILDRAE